MNWPSQLIPRLVNYLEMLACELTGDRLEAVDCGYYKILNKLFYMFAPLLTSVIFYQYFKRMLILNAYRYEVSVKKRCGHFKKLSKQLKILVKRYGNFYFRFLPMNHGTTLPKTYNLFTAIKEVLLNTNKPATRGVRTNLLFSLIQGDSLFSSQNLSSLELSLRNFYDEAYGFDPLSEYNLKIMKFSRELIIQGVKDFEVMSTIFRVLETVAEDMEN